MLTVFAGIYLFFLVESLMRSTTVIWRRIKTPKNAFDLDHDYDTMGQSERKRGKRKKKNSSIELIPETIDVGPSSSTSQSEGLQDSVFVISHKVLRRTFKWDAHKRRHVPSAETVAEGQSDKILEVAQKSTPEMEAATPTSTLNHKGHSSVSIFQALDMV